MKRKIFSQEHEIFRDAFKKFLVKEIAPHYEQWEKDREVPREIYRKAGEQGFLCPWVPEEYGGANADWLYSVVILEEIVPYSGVMLNLHSDVCAPYIATFGTDEQKKKWLPGCCTGEKILAVAMTEPFAGSDLQAIRTTAVKKGDHYIVNGSKTFISNGFLNDLVITAVKTDTQAKGWQGMSLLVIEDGTPGTRRRASWKRSGCTARTPRSWYLRIAQFLFPACWARKARDLFISWKSFSRSGWYARSARLPACGKS